MKTTFPVDFWLDVVTCALVLAAVAALVTVRP